VKPLWIELVDTGVANRFDLDDEERIEVNWRLTDYPELYKKVLSHEVGHQEGRATLKDFWHDMKSKTPGLFSFIKNNPSSWNQLLPIYWSIRHKKLIIDWNRLIDYVIIGSIAIGVYWLLLIIGGLI